MPARCFYMKKTARSVSKQGQLPASLPFKDQVTEQTTVKLSICYRKNNLTMLMDEFMINNRTDAWKPNLTSICQLAHVADATPSYLKENFHLIDCSFVGLFFFYQACLSRPECGRQTLAELLIRPVQRLPSMNLLLSGKQNWLNFRSPNTEPKLVGKRKTQPNIFQLS